LWGKRREEAELFCCAGWGTLTHGVERGELLSKKLEREAKAC